MFRTTILAAATAIFGMLGPRLALADEPKPAGDSKQTGAAKPPGDSKQTGVPKPAGAKPAGESKPAGVTKPASDSKPAGNSKPADDSKQADETFHAGRELLKDKRYADACPKFEESQRQDPASGTLLALAYCQELSGLLATSWTNYIAAAQLAEREGHTDRQSAASERAQALSPRLSRLTVTVPQELLSLPGFHLMRDGIEFERASFNLPVATNGGSHAFEATAPGRVPWTSTVTLQNEHDNKTLVLPVLDQAQNSSSAIALAGRTDASSPPLLDERDAAAEHQATVLRHASLAFAAGSLVGLGLGTAFAFSAQSKNDASNADGHCDARGCDTHGTELRNSALSAARASTWSFIAGGALAATSITLYITSSSVPTSGSGAPRRATRVEGNMSLGAPSVTVTGSF